MLPVLTAFLVEIQLVRKHLLKLTQLVRHVSLLEIGKAVRVPCSSGLVFDGVVSFLLHKIKIKLLYIPERFYTILVPVLKDAVDVSKIC